MADHLRCPGQADHRATKMRATTIPALTPLILSTLLWLSAAISYAQQDTATGTSTDNDLTLPIEKQLRDRISYWARSWAEQRADDYFDFYDEGYAGDGFSNRSAWMANRRSRIEGPPSIRIRLYDFQLLESTDAQATVQFMLLYERPGYSDRTLKQLELILQNGVWYISAESNIRIEVVR